MYSYRTNILLTKDMNDRLNKLSRLSGKTKGELIREAIIRSDILNDASPQKYQTQDKELENFIKSGWKLLKNPEIPINYKEWIEDGRE